MLLNSFSFSPPLFLSFTLVLIFCLSVSMVFDWFGFLFCYCCSFLSLCSCTTFVSFFRFLPVPPGSSRACGALVLQAASQSAVSQEQVDNILQENDALRTNLAALEQVKKPNRTSSRSLTPKLCSIGKTLLP